MNNPAIGEAVSKDDGGPAFPRTAAEVTLDGRGVTVHPQMGMTLRDWFAGQALQGLLADSNETGKWNEFAARAYEGADAMLKERAK